jgi:hypothetical protein
MSGDDEIIGPDQPNDDEQYEVDLDAEELIESLHGGAEIPPFPEDFEANAAAHYATAMRALAMLADQLGGEIYTTDRLNRMLRWIAGQFRRLATIELPPGFGGRAKSARVVGKTLILGLVDGREVRAPLEWFPRLADASESQKDNLQIIEDGRVILWPDIESLMDVAGLLAWTGPQLGATPTPHEARGHIPNAGSIVAAFETTHGPMSERTRDLIGHQWGRPARSRPSDAVANGPGHSGVSEDADQSPVLDGEDELIAYLDRLVVDGNTPVIADLAAVIETLFVTEAAILRGFGNTVDVGVDDLSGQLTVTLAVTRDAWARRLIVVLNPRFVPHVGARILDDNGDIVADIGESTDVDAGIALAFAWAGLARLRGELG